MSSPEHILLMSSPEAVLLRTTKDSEIQFPQELAFALPHIETDVIEQEQVSYAL